MEMPEPDAGIIARRTEIIKAMQGIVSGEGVITDTDELRAYDHDGLMAYKGLPLVVVLPETTEQVSKVLKYCHDNDVKIVQRGAGKLYDPPKGDLMIEKGANRSFIGGGGCFSGLHIASL